MKNKSSILLITLLALSGFMVMANQPVQADGDHTIYIGVVTGTNAYNVTDLTLEPETEYTIVFVNDDVTPHNLRIDVDNDVSESNLGDADDIVIGLANDDAAGADGSWEGTWTTPASGEFTFFCGYAGHYSGGMVGTFTVGDGEDSPGFGLFAGLAALLMIALAVPHFRRN